jgi:hypothetical protein
VTGRGSLLMAATARADETLARLQEEIQQPGVRVPQKVREALNRAIVPNMFEEAVVAEGRSKRTEPFHRAIDMSPISDLAELASALVGVQSVHAAITQDNPTVAGPIDVAVITRSDGFSWIRHKGSK